MLTQKQLKKLFYYNPGIGVFTRLVATSNSVKVGDIAGCDDGQGYIRITVNNKLYKAHHLAWLYMTGLLPKDQIDHINHIRDDNRFINLREATNQENHKNLSKRKDNTSGVTGVYLSKASNKWKAHIKMNLKYNYLGGFIDKFEAICARKSAENKYGFHPNHGK